MTTNDGYMTGLTGLSVDRPHARDVKRETRQTRHADPGRQAAIARVVQVAIATTPSIASARRTLQRWAGHPGDPAMRDDALLMLDRIEQEARQP